MREFVMNTLVYTSVWVGLAETLTRLLPVPKTIESLETQQERRAKFFEHVSNHTAVIYGTGSIILCFYLSFVHEFALALPNPVKYTFTLQVNFLSILTFFIVFDKLLPLCVTFWVFERISP